MKWTHQTEYELLDSNSNGIIQTAIVTINAHFNPKTYKKTTTTQQQKSLSAIKSF